MPKSQGRCIFCGRFGLTGEHVFAAWLQQIFPRSPDHTHTQGRMDWVRGIKEPPMPTYKRRQGHSGTRKVRVVCRCCNNEWLSNLEGDAKAVMIPIIRGAEVSITSDVKKILATWAFKTAIVAENLEPDSKVTPESVYRYMHDNKGVPSGYNVFIAPYVGQKWAHLALHQFSGKLGLPANDSYGASRNYLQITVMGLGHLIFVVTGVRPGSVFFHPSMIPLRRIFPDDGKVILWPRLMFFLNDALTTEIAACARQGKIFDVPRDDVPLDGAERAFTENG